MGGQGLAGADHGGDEDRPDRDLTGPGGQTGKALRVVAGRPRVRGSLGLKAIQRVVWKRLNDIRA